ncbi:hypothetical protein KAR91_04690 [Candidatus Pacearchaeota archaeon]|nr:hypothetical protein [Candidatus Pacearchaeota archaeon]
MTHKDWKGAGVYNCFEGKKWICTKPKDQSNHLCGSFSYERLENFKPPELPVEKLPDGLYYAEIDTER